MNRETWLNEMAALMAPRFEELGHPLPKFRVAVGWTSAGKSSGVAGECWHSSTSADQTFEILIAPILDDSMAVAATLAHELIHAAVGFHHKHQGDFQRTALKLGLNRPMTATTAGPAFKEWAKPFIDQLGPLPHAKVILDPLARPRGENADGLDGDDGEEGDAPKFGSSNAKPKQPTRLLKASCDKDREVDGGMVPCGYTVRVTRKWALELGAPHCPLHGAMEVEGLD